MLSPEQFCDQVIEALEQGIQDALDAQTTAWAARDAAASRTITLTAPRSEDYYPGGATGVLLRYPAIEVAVPDMTMANFSLHHEDADVAPTLMVRVLFQDAASAENLYRRGCRWFAAVLTILGNPDTFPELDAATVSAHWRFNPQTNERDQVQSGVLITFGLEGALSPYMA